MNDAVKYWDFVTKRLRDKNDISTYINRHTKVDERIVPLQCEDFWSDQIVTLDKEFQTR